MPPQKRTFKEEDFIDEPRTFLPEEFAEAGPAARRTVRSFLTETLPEYAKEEAPVWTGAAAGGATGAAAGAGTPLSLPLMVLGSILGGMGGGYYTARRKGETTQEALERISRGGVTGMLQESAPVARGAERTARAVGGTLERRLPSIPLTRAERGRRGTAFFESAAERIITGSGPFQRFRRLQQEELAGPVTDRLLGLISRHRGTAEGLGIRVQKELKKSKDEIGSAIGSLYREIDDLVRAERVRVPVGKRQVPTEIVGPRGEMLTRPQVIYRKKFKGSTLVDTKPLKEVAISLLKRLQEEELLIDPSEIARSKRILLRMVKSPRKMSFTGVQDARSTLLAISRSFVDPVPGKAGGLAKKLSGEVDNAMMRAARLSDNPEVEDMIRVANAQWKRFTETFNETVVADILKKAPEKAHNLLRKADLEDIRRLKEVLPLETFQAMKANLLRDLLDDATAGELLTKLPKVYARTVEWLGLGRGPYPVLNPKKLQRALENQIGLERLEVLFGPREMEAVLGFVGTAQRIGSAARSSLLPALTNLALTYGAYRALTRGDVAALAEPAAVGIGVNLMARLMTSTRGVFLLSSFLKALESGNLRRITVAAGGIVPYLGREERGLEPGVEVPVTLEPPLEAPGLTPPPSPEINP